MAFQFLCPQGHLLQGEESQAGQKCKCPYCSVEFMVPPPSGVVEQQPQSPEQPAAEEAWAAEQETFPAMGPQAEGDVVGQLGLPGASQTNVVHVICPNGHQLETPRDMLGQEAMCPFCQSQFRLRFEDSVEGREEKARRRAKQEEKLAKAWLNWTIGIAFVVVVGVITMIAMASLW